MLSVLSCWVSRTSSVQPSVNLNAKYLFMGFRHYIVTHPCFFCSPQDYFHTVHLFLIPLGSRDKMRSYQPDLDGKWNCDSEFYYKHQITLVKQCKRKCILLETEKRRHRHIIVLPIPSNSTSLLCPLGKQGVIKSPRLCIILIQWPLSCNYLTIYHHSFCL